MDEVTDTTPNKHKQQTNNSTWLFSEP